MLYRHTVALLSWLLDWEILLSPRNLEKNKDLWLAAPVSADLQCFRHQQPLSQAATAAAQEWVLAAEDWSALLYLVW